MDSPDQIAYAVRLERILDATLAEVAHRGVASTKAGHVARRAGVTEAEVRDLFVDVDEALAAAVEWRLVRAGRPAPRENPAVCGIELSSPAPIG
jgi:AcrR family transcriptional regulator